MLRQFVDNIHKRVACLFSSFKLVCIKQIADGVLESVLMFLNENTVLERFMHMDEGSLKYVTTVKKQNLDDLAKKFHIKIEPCFEDDRCGTYWTFGSSWRNELNPTNACYDVRMMEVRCYTACPFRSSASRSRK